MHLSALDYYLPENPLDEKVEKRVRPVVATNLVDYIEDNICPKISLEAIVRKNERLFRSR